MDDDDDFAKRRAFDVSSELEADIARYAERQAREVSSSGGASNAPASSAAVSAMDGVKEAIDTFLLYDFFVILFIPGVARARRRRAPERWERAVV